MDKLVKKQDDKSLAMGRMARAKKNIACKWLVERRNTKKRAAQGIFIVNSDALILVDESRKRPKSFPCIPIQDEFVCSSLCLVLLTTKHNVIILKGGQRYPSTLVSNPFYDCFCENGSLVLEKLDWSSFSQLVQLSPTEDNAVVLRYSEDGQDKDVHFHPGHLCSKPTNSLSMRLLVKGVSLESPFLKRFLSSAPVDKNKDLPQVVNGFVAMLLQEVAGDDAQTRSIVQCKEELMHDETRKAKKVVDERLKVVEAEVEMLKNEKRISDECIINLATEELTGPQVTVFHKFVEEVVGAAFKAHFKEMYTFNQPLLPTKQMMALTAKFVSLFPRLCGIRMKTIFLNPSESLSQQEMEQMVMLGFIFDQRKDNSRYCLRLVEVFGLAFYFLGFGNRGITFLNKQGMSCCYRQVLKRLECYRRENAGSSHALLKSYHSIMMGFDNWQMFLPEKYQRSGKGQSLKGCVRYATEMPLITVPATTMYPVNEAQPVTLDYVRPLIPAPILMLPYEDASSEDLKQFVIGNMNAIRQDNTLLFQKLGLVTALPFNMGRMLPTNGKRVKAYVDMVHLCNRIRDLKRTVASRECFDEAYERFPHSPFSNRVFELAAASNGKDILKGAERFQGEAVKQYNPFADNVSKLHVLPLTSTCEETHDGTGKVALEMAELAGLIDAVEKEDVQGAEHNLGRWIAMVGDQLTIDHMRGFYKRLLMKCRSMDESHKKMRTFSKVLSRIVPVVGELHLLFHITDAIFKLNYGGFIQVFQVALQIKRLGKDPTSNFQTALYLMRIMDRAFKRAMHREWLSTSPVCNFSCFLQVQAHFDAFMEERRQSTDEVAKAVVLFMDEVDLLLGAYDGIRLRDAIFLEACMDKAHPLFYATKKENYQRLMSQHKEAMYQTLTVEGREQIRCSRYMKLNPGRRAVAGDDLCEIINDETKRQHGIKTMQAAEQRSHCLMLLRHCTMNVDMASGLRDCNGNSKQTKSSTSPKLTSMYKRAEELIDMACLTKLDPERKIENMQLEKLLPLLQTKLESKQSASEECADNDGRDASFGWNEAFHMLARGASGDNINNLDDDAIYDRDDVDSGGEDGELQLANDTEADNMENIDSLKIGLMKREKIHKLFGKKNPMVHGLNKMDNAKITDKRNQETAVMQKALHYINAIDEDSRQRQNDLDETSDQKYDKRIPSWSMAYRAGR